MSPAGVVARRRMFPISSSACSRAVFTGPKLGELEVVRIEAVERGEVADEVLGDSYLFVGILDPVEPVLARDALGQHRFVLGVDGEGPRHGHVGVLQRHEHFGFDAQRKEGGVGRSLGAAVAEEQGVDRAVAVDVDEPRFATRATWHTVRRGDPPTGRVLDPDDDVVWQGRARPLA